MIMMETNGVVKEFKKKKEEAKETYKITKLAESFKSIYCLNIIKK